MITSTGNNHVSDIARLLLNAAEDARASKRNRIIACIDGIWMTGPADDTCIQEGDIALIVLPDCTVHRFFPDPKEVDSPSAKWLRVGDSTGEAKEGHYDGGDFSEIRMVINNRPMFQANIAQASGALGYALKQEIAGESLSDPRTAASVLDNIVLDYSYDSTKSQRDDPDFIHAFSIAQHYIENGSPIRKTDRAGKGTKGTRLVEGIGATDITFWVR